MRPALLAFAGLVAIYTLYKIIGIINPTVFMLPSIVNGFRSMPMCFLVGIGQSYVMITGNIDLSIGSIAGMSAMMSATLMSRGQVSPPLTIIITIGCCLLVGLINGILVGRLKLPSYIATLSMMYVARGVAYSINN